MLFSLLNRMNFDQYVPFQLKMSNLVFLHGKGITILPYKKNYCKVCKTVLKPSFEELSVES